MAESTFELGFDPALPCPCGSGAAYGACCAPLHAGEAAPTAERLMRSRYAAFVTLNEPYLLQTWHKSTRPASMDLDESIEWKRLFISDTTAGGEYDTEGFVVFTAIARTEDGRFEQRERSRFVRDGAGRWVYIDGEVE